MEPMIRDGSLGVFKRHNGAVPEGHVALVVRGDGWGDASLVVKRVVRAADGWALESMNPVYSPLAVQQSDRFVGTFVRVLPS